MDFILGRFTHFDEFSVSQVNPVSLEVFNVVRLTMFPYLYDFTQVFYQCFTFSIQFDSVSEITFGELSGGCQFFISILRDEVLVFPGCLGCLHVDLVIQGGKVGPDFPSVEYLARALSILPRALVEMT